MPDSGIEEDLSFGDEAESAVKGFCFALRIQEGPANVTITGDAAGNDLTTADGITRIKDNAQADLLDNVRPMAITGDNEESLLRGLTLTGGYVRVPGPESGSPSVPGAGNSSWSGGGLFVNEGSVTFDLPAKLKILIERAGVTRD